MERVGLAVVLGLMASGLAQTAVAQIGDFQESSARRQALAEAWAPIFFHDEASEFVSTTTGFSPVDTPLSFFFDGDQDLRDNGISAFRLNHQSESENVGNVPLYYSVIESRSHIYLNYVVYHALDAKEMSHVHDTENVWMVVEKDESPFGKLEMVVTNAHGFPMIYGPSSSEEAIWKTRVPDSMALQFLPAIDRFSSRHNDEGRPEFLSETDSQHFMAFIARLGHGIYKFNRNAWGEMGGRGSVYIPKTCGSCRTGIGTTAESSPVRYYNLVDLDQVIDDVLSSGNLERFFNLDTQSRLATAYSRDRMISANLAPGLNERDGRINLFYSQTFKTRIRLSDPARVHLFFDPENQSVSSTYLYNFYLKPGVLVADAPTSRENSMRFNRASLLYFVGRIFD